MKIVIKIPEEFEEHFKLDRFEDSLSRVASDIESFGFQLAGRYELETVTMLRDAIKNSTPFADKCKECGRPKSVIERVEEELRDVIDMHKDKG